MLAKKLGNRGVDGEEQKRKKNRTVHKRNSTWGHAVVKRLSRAFAQAGRRGPAVG